MARTFIEKIAQKMRIIPDLDREHSKGSTGELRKYPDPENWNDHVELDAQEWPKIVEKRYSLVPTTCFNCESACGMLAYVDKDSGEVSKFEGNPHHPGSRGRNCANGPAQSTKSTTQKESSTPSSESVSGVKASGRESTGIRHWMKSRPKSEPRLRLRLRTESVSYTHLTLPTILLV